MRCWMAAASANREAFWPSKTLEVLCTIQSSKTTCAFLTPSIHPEALLIAIFKSLTFQNHHPPYSSGPPLRYTWGPNDLGTLTPHGTENRRLRKNDTCDLGTESRFDRQQKLVELKSCYYQKLLVLESRQYSSVKGKNSLAVFVYLFSYFYQLQYLKRYINTSDYS